jgi:two-component system sensor histidine kinase BaeS
LGFGAPTSGAAQQIAWAWIVIAGLAALLTAFAVSWYVTGRISRPLARLTATARTFAAGDRSARSEPHDVEAPGELGELVRAFDATADQVERSELARRRMAADLAHELRTPLAALQAGLDELRDGLVEPDRARLEALHGQSLRVGRVVDDLAELSAAETASLTLRREPVDLGRIVEEAVAAARPTTDAARLVLVVHVGEHLVVEGDADRLHQVIGNLLVNTARHCRSGDTVTVSTSREGLLARVVVADTGPGIPQDDLPYVFDRLWRGRADSDAAGSGIGLAVVRELVTAHGGSVTVASDATHGTTFTVTLPLATGVSHVVSPGS